MAIFQDGVAIITPFHEDGSIHYDQLKLVDSGGSGRQYCNLWGQESLRR